MSRTIFVVALAAALLAAGAGSAEAKKDGPVKAPELPDHASAKAPAKRAPAAAPGAGAAAEDAPEPAPSTSTAGRRAPSTSDADDLTLAQASAPTAPTRAERLDTMFAAPGAAIASGPRFAPGIGAPGGSSESGGDAPWWLALLWALPLAGVGGVGTVLLMRRKGATAITDAKPRTAMAPAEPSDLSGLLRNGHAAVARGSLDEGIAWFDAALRLAPTLAVAHFCKGVCLAANGRVAEAYGALDEAVWAAPDDASYRVHFARVALALGKHNEAMDSLAFVTRAMPELGPAMLEDPQLAGLRDHPRFLMICGEL